MKLIRYTLNIKGEIPDYVVDGGYFAKKNENRPPMDYDFIGVSKNDIGLEEYTQITFESYIKSFKPLTTELDGKTHNLQDELDVIWNKTKVSLGSRIRNALNI
jgi:hypothetical protein